MKLPNISGQEGEGKRTVGKKWKQKYKDLSIRKKIILVFVTSFVFFMLLVLIVPNVVLYRSNLAKIEQNIQEECKMIDLQINNLYDNMRNCWNSSVQGINQVYQSAETEELNEVSSVTVRKNLSSVLNYYKNCFKEVDSLVFQDMSGNVVNIGLHQNPNSDMLAELIQDIPDFGPVEAVIFPVEPREAFEGSDTDPILTMGVRVLRINTGELLGYLFINMKTSTIEENFPSSEEQAYHKNYYIIDEQNRIVADSNPENTLLRDVDQAVTEEIEKYGNDSFRITVNGQKVLLTSRENQSFGWKVVSQVPMGDLLKDIYFMAVAVIGIGVLCMVLAIAMVLILSREITRPVENLTEAADHIARGELSYRCSADTKDEVGTLSKAFNSMVEQIQKLLEQVKEEQKQKRETELALFQIQIKPHFLYNTLDLIYVCCEMDEKEVAGRIAKALADYYRTSLSGGAEIISVKEEIQNIENYLYIQRERYSDVISYNIDVPEECGKYKIPKLTLQPLVENAIYHGLKEKDGEGCICIRAQDEGTTIRLEVEDDGVGMSEQDFERILQKKDERGKAHFGLKNVHERLQLYFGEGYGLALEKSGQTGTCIRISIPKIEVYDD